MNLHAPLSENGKPTGAAMVVGGGIAGMQASLDLADQGFKVYLVETRSAIGGKMAQLDKTFPTNDCAMCTISPKLVESARHPNIEILTDTDVLGVDGEAGRFRARLRRLPRYVNVDRCIACNQCVEVCPVSIPNAFNEGLDERRAIFKLYPQAVPNAYAIQKRGVAPCRDACPAGQRAQGYIAMIREGRWDDALRVIKLDNPFPGICGRICNHRCETACNRGLVDEPVNIRALKRFVTDRVYEKPRQRRPPAEILHPDQKVAVIGAGPCGLTAAQDVLTAGYPVTVFEAMPVAGGMLRLGVPEYRMPTAVIEREVQDILDLGVELKLNHRIDDLEALFEQGFRSVLIAAGAHEGIRLPIPGADLDGVLINTHFLREVRLGRLEESTVVRERVLVLGGGNVALDCARTALRLEGPGGRPEVHLACLEGRDEMPAHEWEIEAAVQEGVILHPGRTFERIVGDENGRPTGVVCSHVASFHFDAAGRLHLEKAPDSLHILPCDTVIFSVGQRAGLAFLPDDAGVGLTERRTIAVNPGTFATSRPGVFAAGDSVSGTTFVIEAVASGHKAARSILCYLKGEALEQPSPPSVPVAQLTRDEIDERLRRGEIVPADRVRMGELSLEARLDNFREVELGYDEVQAREEAARCLACGVCSECMSCVDVCGVNAIDHDMVVREEEIEVGAVILAPGYQVYHAELSEEYGYGRFPNVINALQMERLLSASGPTMGHVQRPSDGAEPERIAFLQCIGSRDQSHDYCSAVCCMYATKEAVMAKEHHPGLDVHVFFMDVRAFSKGYWAYFERSKDHYGVKYHRSRVSALQEDPNTRDIILSYFDELGELHQEHFDLAVLSVGMEIGESVKALGRDLNVELDEYGFCHTPQFNPVETSRGGIFAVGPFREPKDIPESVVEAGSAAASVAEVISPSRFSMTTNLDRPPERDTSEQPPRVGVFVCHCGSNIAGFLDVPGVTEYAEGLPGVVHAESNLYTCSQDNIRHISEVIEGQSLNRVVVASCTPLTHAPLFKDSLRAAGLNPYLFEMANIRNQCSWVHSQERDQATSKARDLVRMAAARAALLEPQHTLDVPVEKAALIVGGGAAGMTAALSLAEQGFPVHLVEKEMHLGGNLAKVFTSLPADPAARKSTGLRGSPQETLERLRREVEGNPRISLHMEARVVESRGFTGCFSSTIECSDGSRMELKHGAAILATGAQEYAGPEYDYGSDPRVLSQMGFESVLAGRRPEVPIPDRVVMIQCVGPARDFCSRICCTVAIKNALALKALKPEAQVSILYKDIRTYGFKERLYAQAREAGVIFIRYDDEHEPQVVSGRPLMVRAWDPVLQAAIELESDLLVLSMPVVPRPSTQALAKLFKVPLDHEGFFLEAHVKLRPVDFASGGIFMAGMAHYPRLLDETMIQARAAAARAARILSRDSLTAGGRVAVVDEARCTGCLTCVRICPFSVPRIQPQTAGVGGILGAAHIEAAVCQGCGICAAECPARAIQLLHYTDIQMEAKVEALVRLQDVPTIASSERV